MARPRGAKARATEVIARLAAEYPDAQCALVHEGPFQLLVATILSAQTTDETVNKVTPKLFARYPTPADLAGADPDELEGLIRPTGFFHSKARSLLGTQNNFVDVLGFARRIAKSHDSGGVAVIAFHAAAVIEQHYIAFLDHGVIASVVRLRAIRAGCNDAKRGNAAQSPHFALENVRKL